MNSLNKKLSVYTALAWILTILALSFRLLSRLLAFDSEIGYFRSDALFPLLQSIALIALFLLSLSGPLLFRKNTFPESVSEGMKTSCVAEKISASISALILLVSLIASVILFWGVGSIPGGTYELIGVGAGFVSILFFLLFCSPAKRGRKLHMFTGFFFVLYLLFLLTVSYFEFYTPMNNPVKILFQLSAIVSIFYMLADLRFFLDLARPARFLSTSVLMIGCSTVMVVSMPFFTVPSEQYTTLYRILTAVFLALLVYGTARLSRFLALCARADLVNEEEKSDDEASPETPEAVSEDLAPTPSETTESKDTEA